MAGKNTVVCKIIYRLVKYRIVGVRIIVGEVVGRARVGRTTCSAHLN
jgi:hypothetical protein